MAKTELGFDSVRFLSASGSGPDKETSALGQRHGIEFTHEEQDPSWVLISVDKFSPEVREIIEDCSQVNLPFVILTPKENLERISKLRKEGVDFSSMLEIIVYDKKEEISAKLEVWLSECETLTKAVD